MKCDEPKPLNKPFSFPSGLSMPFTLLIVKLNRDACLVFGGECLYHYHEPMHDLVRVSDASVSCRDAQC